MANLELSFASGLRDVHVRQFAVRESVSKPFVINVMVRSPDPSLDLGGIVGQGAGFRVQAGYAHVKGGGARTWRGIVANAEQTEALQETTRGEGLSTYTIQIVPQLWLLTQRRGNRIYQHLSIPDIVTKLLGEWGIGPEWRIDSGAYPKLEYKVQYAESDYDFMSRLLEEAGIAFTFADSGAPIMGDKLQSNEARSGGAIPYVDTPNRSSQKEYVTDVRFGHEVRPGATLFRDYNFRNPDFKLFAKAPSAEGIEAKMEQYFYDAGAFWAELGKDAHTPAADDQSFSRHDQDYGTALATRTLEAERAGNRTVSASGNTFDLGPGSVFSIAGHPHSDISAGQRLLVVAAKLTGTDTGDINFSVEAHFADKPHRPPRRTPKPIIHGVQSAKVVGPSGQEIHTDEFGRVRVQLPWDREGNNDERSSCWVRVNQGWGGMGYGMVTLPRVGQEVLVSFLEGDPDFPMIVGRVFNASQPVPHKLPQHMTRSTWKSDSSLGSDGFNEIMFEDLAGTELVWAQAEKDRQRIVNNDEFSTIVHDRQKYVKNDEHEQTSHNRQTLVVKDVDIVIKQKKNETHDNDVHQLVKGDRNEKIDGKQSLNVVKSRAEKVEGRYAARAGAEIHHVAGEKWVGEAGSNAAIKAPGGFISLHDGGVTIVGTMVWINERGEPGDAEVAEPEQPFDKKEPEEAPPEVKVDSAGMSDTMSDPEYAEGIANPEDL
jgi:type VI secretion system secreted protein VgrG